MENRYENVTNDEKDLLREVRAEFFPELRNANIQLLFDLKKRASGGKIVLGRIMKSNDLIRHLTQCEEIEDGIDYIISLDKIAWDAIERPDRIRIIRHELRHCVADLESEKAPYKLQDHDLTDFYAEVELNADDPKWRERVADLTQAIYEQKEDE
jgi:hypothetical protein